MSIVIMSSMFSLGGFGALILTYFLDGKSLFWKEFWCRKIF